MRYNISSFNAEVNLYKSRLRNVKSVYVYGGYKNFFSLAPFSKACSDLEIDLHLSISSRKDNDRVIFEMWEIYENLKNKRIGKKEACLRELLDTIDIDNFERFFEKPDLILKTSDTFFQKSNWFKPVMEKELRKTTDAIVKNVYALKKSEKFSIGFALIPKEISHPLNDFLDSYAICHNMFLSSRFCSSVVLKAGTERKSMLDEPEKVSELMTTISGMELEKDLPLPVFKRYKELSWLLKLEKIKIPDASFFISTKGYHGRHYFGEKYGYPTRNMKDKWPTPGGIIHKLYWSPQSKNEDRLPLSRYAFTSTVPIERLVESCLIDYKKMRKRNNTIKKILEKCDTVYVKSKYSNFEVSLNNNGKRRLIMKSDSDVRTKINPQVLKETGMKVGRMGNIPGGEAFTTPFFIKGKIIGDVVINVDRSYRLSKNGPVIIEADKAGYKIIKGPKVVIDAYNRKISDAKKNLANLEKNNSISKEIIELKKKNFYNIGEFAINTNPNAKLCDYLIINEKIANMIHIALGSGFEPDSSTEYHMDIVIDAPRQKLDIFGTGKKNYWILKEGKFCV